MGSSNSKVIEENLTKEEARDLLTELSKEIEKREYKGSRIYKSGFSYDIIELAFASKDYSLVKHILKNWEDYKNGYTGMGFLKRCRKISKKYGDEKTDSLVEKFSTNMTKYNSEEVISRLNN